MSKDKLKLNPVKFSGTLTLTEYERDLIEKTQKNLLDVLLEKKISIISSVIQQLLPGFKINAETGKRITRITFDENPHKEVYFFDYEKETQLFLMEIESVYNHENGFEPRIEIIAPEGVNLDHIQ